jgi:hypothetical protein
MCRALLYYLAQTWTADLHRQAQRDKPARAASQPGIPAVRAASRRFGRLRHLGWRVPRHLVRHRT